jgi:hypothetical protein
VNLSGFLVILFVIAAVFFISHLHILHVGLIIMLLLLLLGRKK